MDHLDDAELLRRYAEDQSETAFNELARRHLNLIYRSALRQTGGDQHLAEEIGQAVLTQLARKAASLVRHPCLAGWLYTATYRVTQARRRTERRRLIREHAAHLMHENSPEAAAADWSRIGPVLDEAMRALTHTDREAILLHYLEGRPFAEVGLRLRLREDAARMRVRRALEKLRRSLVRRGVSSSIAVIGSVLVAESAHASPATLTASAAQIAATYANVGTAPLAVLFQIMSTSKIALGMAAVVAGLAAGAGVRSFAQVRAGSVAVAVWEQRTAEAASKLAGMEAAPKQAVVGRRTTASGQIAGITTVGSTLTPQQAAQELEVQRLKDRAQMAAFLLEHGAQMRSAGLTEVQIQRLAEAGLNIASEYAELKLVASMAGTDIQSDPVLHEMAQELQLRANQEYVTITGQSGFDSLTSALSRDHAQTAAASSNSIQFGQATYAANQVAGLLFAGATPLTTEQRTQLVQLIAQNSPDYQTQAEATMDSINWDRVTEQAGGTLAPAQIAAIKSLGAETQQWALEKQIKVAALASHTP